MDGVDVSADHIIAELVEMGFEFSKAVEAAKSVGPCLQDAVDFILNVSWGKSTAENKTDYKPVDRSLSSKGCSSSQASLLGKRSSCSYPEKRVKQSTITKHLQSLDGKKKCNRVGASGAVFLLSNESEASLQDSTHRVEPVVEPFQGVPGEHCLPLCGASGDFGSNWEQKAQNILQKHFGFSSLKGFQKEAIEAWLANRDCLVLAATGSGKSLCFQIPALLSGKVVVVISPLISLMHDQCLKLAKHGVSACFLGSGQTDSTVEHKAMRGLYGIVYVCPETVLRLIGPLQKLAENRGIALFAIDEVHCISKWGHDFRPDYRKLSILRENFKAFKLKMLKFDIPLMALTATATTDVREDILKSLHMSKETKVVLTSFFRPNLRFSVRHSRTSCISSYCKDFKDLIDAYCTKRMTSKGKSHTLIYGTEDQFNGSNISDELHLNDCEISSDSCNENSSETSLTDGNSEMTVEFLEDEVDLCKDGDDLDVFSAEFHPNYPYEDSGLSGSSERPALPVQCEQLLEVPQGSEGQGPTIIYVPTRKETLTLAKYLCSIGVKAAAYHAKLPKTHLRQVHKKFHQNVLQVVVATIAFGMGIDKSNVRRIIHYGWPQSLEAYYQEAGRAGRDGKLADCTLYADLSKIPSLLPSQRSKEQTRHAYKLLRDCLRYGMATTCCRAKTLVSYFGELASEKCLLCDVCVSGPPGLQNMKAEADAFMRVLASYSGSNVCEGSSYERPHSSNGRRGRHMGKANLRMVISQIREQYQGFASTDRLWWQGLARLLEEKGYLREGDDMIRVSMKYPEVTELGLKFISETEKNFYAYPEADMLLSKQTQKPFSSFSEWGRGWADPQIRRQRLEGRKGRRKIRKKKYSRKHDKDLKTVRGRITAKLSK
ncbi:LOW QUALITY PROTEIN: ATP-dependent DNA helicase Q-like SIM [Aristolochia californica]|uniref:LOW QUALITY PROTEIN: ATP-dependent DNA helicase Q-like SIM n=1 Tax=Aristolochia californica TaxID=171875 RepID=UPI0035D5B36B